MDFKLVQYACDLLVSDLWCPRVTCRAVRKKKNLVDLDAAARATCHVPPAYPRPAPMSFRRFGTSIGATPVPIGPAVWALCLEMLEHTDTLTNTIRPNTRPALLSIALGQNRRYSKHKFNKGLIFYGKGALPVCTCARAPCTPPPSNIRY